MRNNVHLPASQWPDDRVQGRWSVPARGQGQQPSVESTNDLVEAYRGEIGQARSLVPCHAGFR